MENLANIYLISWVAISLFLYVNILYIHMKAFVDREDEALKRHVEEHIAISSFMFLSQFMFFLWTVSSENTGHIGISHIAIGMMTVGNIYFARHINREIVNYGRERREA